MKTTKKKKALIVALAAVFLLSVGLSVWIAYENKAPRLTEIEIRSADIPESFYGYRIAQVSDLHNAVFGKDNEKLLSLIRDAEPDVIFVTGDLIDSRNADVEIAEDFMESALEIAPCYYVTGNHESRVLDDFEALERALSDMGVTVLRGESAVLEKGEGSVTLMGVDDPAFGKSIRRELSRFSKKEGFRILLSHRPEYFDTYVDSGVDLVFSGHAHGGQFRLPLVGGVVAPGQGIFPEYTEDAYTEGDTTMIVSRGLGNSLFPFRINNCPEVVLAELWGEE